jgi:hypothetical protein
MKILIFLWESPYLDASFQPIALVTKPCRDFVIRKSETMNQPEAKYDQRKPFIMLAPHNAVTPAHFGVIIRDPEAHTRMSSEMQIVRGAVALAEGAIRPESLDIDSRYQMPGDADSWHLVRMGDDNQIRGSARIMVHEDGVSFARLRLSQSAIARSSEWKLQVRFGACQRV